MTRDGNGLRISRHMEVSCDRCPLRRLKTFRKFTPEELRFVQSFKIGEVRIGPGRTILEEGSPSDHLFTVLSGWAAKFKSLDDGRRQIINYALPGDFMGLQASASNTLEHSVESLTEMVLCAFDKAKIWTLYRDHPGLGFDITWIVAREKAILADFLLTVGQRTASERIAFLIHNVFRRARSVGLLSPDGKLALPINQQDISDTIGFSLVHTNKSLSALKRTGAFEWSGSTLRVIDEALLQRIADDPARESPLRPFI